MTQMGSCRQGDHEACIRTVYPERRDCDCRCHKLSSINVEHRPTSRDPRVKSRQQSWNGHWWLVAFPGYVDEYKDESIIRPPLTKEELWNRLESHR